MKRSYLIITIVTASLMLLLAIYFFQKYNSEKKLPPILITSVRLNVQYDFEFYYVSSPLSIGSIQVRQIHNTLVSGNYNGGPREETHEVYLLEEYEGYDNLVAYSLYRDSITVFLRKGYSCCDDSLGFVKCDTFHLNIYNVKNLLKKFNSEKI